MKCLWCGKNYINLGVHLRHKHHVDPANYKEEFGMMKTMPLVDADLSEHMSKAMKRRLLDVDYLAETIARCKENAVKNIGKPPAKQSLAGKAKVSERNRKVHANRLNKLAPVVAEILAKKKTLIDVRRAIGMGPNAVKKIVNMGKAEYSKDVARIVGTERRELAKTANGAHHTKFGGRK